MSRVFILAAAFGFFLAGHVVTAGYYKSKLQQQALDAAVARAEQGARDYAKIIEAQNGLDSWRAAADSLSSELERVRKQSASRAVRESADACSMERAAVARCERLLERSADAVARCSDLLQRNAAIHDAFAEVNRK